MIELISQYEKDIIDYYRTHYTGRPKADAHFAPVEELLKPWEMSKKNLFDMFGGQLILSKPISIKASTGAISNMMYQEIDNNPNHIYQRFENAYYNALDKYMCGEGARDYIPELNTITNPNPSKWDLDQVNFDLCSTLERLMNWENIVNLVWGYRSTVIKFPKSKKELRLDEGQTKTMRALGKVVEEIGMDKQLFEEFRINVSQWFNTAKIEGKLCLSIHPLDFITMSENSLKWSSCMNWHNTGCYRRGTVEMMNSPMVIVAYVEHPKKPYDITKDLSWGNKIWRELFIVDNDVIAGIKGYPYTHTGLENEVLRWLKELAASRSSVRYSDIVTYGFENCELNKNCNHTFLNFQTNIMYNDFGTTENGCHQVIYNFDTYDCYFENPDADFVELNYSGASQCMWCGEIDDWDYENNGCDNTELFPNGQHSLICHHCDSFIGFCECCGNEMYADDDHHTLYDPTEGDDVMWCNYCYTHYHRTCPITGDIINTQCHFSHSVERFLLADAPPECGYTYAIFATRGTWFEHPEIVAKYTTQTNFERLPGYRTVRTYSIDWDLLTPEGRELFREDRV